MFMPGLNRSTIVGLICVAVMSAGCRKPSAAEHVKRGQALAEQGRFADAIFEFRIALQADPKRGDVRLQLGDAYLRANDPRNALGEYVRAADLLPQSIDAQLKAGRLLLLGRAFEDARARADRAIALDPKSVDAQVLHGNAMVGLKDFDAAVSEYQDAIALDPSQSETYSNLGAVQLVQGKRAEAEKTFRKAVEAAPQSLTARLALANFFWATGDRANAESALKAALQIDAQNLEVNRALGLFYMATGRMPEAEPYFAAIAQFAHTDAASLTLADYYTVAKRPDEARRLLVDIAAHEASFATANIRLAALDAAEGHRAQAQERLRDVLQKQPKEPTALLLSARVSLADGKRDEARTTVNTLIANDANSPIAARAFFLAGQIDTASDRIDDAIKDYERVLKVQQRPWEANVALSRLYLGQGNADKASTYAQQALSIQPSSADAQSLLIRAAIAGGNITRANTELAALQKAFPGSVAVARLTALVQLASKQNDSARASYIRILQTTPNDFEALAGVVQIDLTTGHAKEALARVEERLKRGEPSVDLLVLGARVRAVGGDLPGAESLLKKAIETDPDRLPAYNLLGQLYARQNRLDEAKAQYADVLKRHPKSIAAGTMIAMVLEHQRLLPDAEKEYQRVLSIDPNAAVAANNLAWLYVSSNRKLDEALQLSQTALRQLPDEPNVHDTLGWIYYRKNMAASAIPHLESSIRTLPNDPTFRYHLGMALVQTGDWNKAREQLKRAFSLQPTFEGAAEAKKALDMIGT